MSATDFILPILLAALCFLFYMRGYYDGKVMHREEMLKFIDSLKATDDRP